MAPMHTSPIFLACLFPLFGLLTAAAPSDVLLIGAKANPDGSPWTRVTTTASSDTLCSLGAGQRTSGHSSISQPITGWLVLHRARPARQNKLACSRVCRWCAGWWGEVMNIDTPDQGAAIPSGIVECVFHSAEENGALRLNEDPVAMLGAYNDEDESSQRQLTAC
jgi:hypothetical protein